MVFVPGRGRKPFGDGKAEVIDWGALIHEAVEVSRHVARADAEEGVWV
jgi:hypothetical protein